MDPIVGALMVGVAVVMLAAGVAATLLGGSRG